MITGTIDAFLGAWLHLTVSGPGGQQDVEARVDTGFNGFLSLSLVTLGALGLSPVALVQTTLGDGSVINLPVFNATVLWDGQDRTVETDGVDGLCLVGMSLLEGHIVRMPVRPGATFEIEALP